MNKMTITNIKETNSIMITNVSPVIKARLEREAKREKLCAELNKVLAKIEQAGFHFEIGAKGSTTLAVHCENVFSDRITLPYSFFKEV